MDCVIGLFIWIFPNGDLVDCFSLFLSNKRLNLVLLRNDPVDQTIICLSMSVAADS